jgi:hypothetical protein
LSWNGFGAEYCRVERFSSMRLNFGLSSARAPGGNQNGTAVFLFRKAHISVTENTTCWNWPTVDPARCSSMSCSRPVTRDRPRFLQAAVPCNDRIVQSFYNAIGNPEVSTSIATLFAGHRLFRSLGGSATHAPRPLPKPTPTATLADEPVQQRIERDHRDAGNHVGRGER